MEEFDLPNMVVCIIVYMLFSTLPVFLPKMVVFDVNCCMLVPTCILVVVEVKYLQ